MNVSPTCRSWGPSALSSVCQKGRRHHHLHHPQHHFHLNRTEHCCLTGAGRAERDKKKGSGAKTDEKGRQNKSPISLVHFQHVEFSALLWPQSNPTCLALGE